MHDKQRKEDPRIQRRHRAETAKSSVSVSRAPGTTGVFEIDGGVGATYRATSNIIKNGVTPIEWLLLRIQ